VVVGRVGLRHLGGRQGAMARCLFTAAAAVRLLLLVACSASRTAALSSCWVGGFDWEHCCGAANGPGGNVQCWDEIFLYDPCCTHPDDGPGEGAISGEAAPDPALAVLERSLGPKLSNTLSENNQSLAEIEEDLRTTINVPENRSMAGPMTHAYLALVLNRQGRFAEAAAEFHHFMANNFTIADNGVWVGTSAAAYHMHDSPFSKELVTFLTGRGARSVVDFGCGLGLYVRDMRAEGMRVGGFDGNPDTVEITGGRCSHLDLSREVDFGVYWDWVLSLEVAEHIPPQFEDNFVGNLVRHTCWGLVLSWGNQAGEGHVNVRTRAEVEEIFAAHGFRSEREAAERLRKSARLPWLQNTVLVLERIEPLADCVGRASTPPAR